MDVAQQLFEIEAIKRLKASYFRCFDTKDWDGWLALFTDDATLEFGGAVGSGGSDPDVHKLVGKKAIGDYVVPYTDKAQTVHHGHMPEIDLLSDAEARGVWAMEDIVDKFDNVIHGFGHYHETYRKENGEWRFTSVRLTRLRLFKTSRDRITI